jgi:hypothetical protein
MPPWDPKEPGAVLTEKKGIILGSSELETEVLSVTFVINPLRANLF